MSGVYHRHREEVMYEDLYAAHDKIERQNALENQKNMDVQESGVCALHLICTKQNLTCTKLPGDCDHRKGLTNCQPFNL